MSARTHGLVLPRDSGANLRLNLDGLVAESDTSYAILFRNGTFESASGSIVNGAHALWQAAGLEYCSHFDSDGNLKPRR